MKQDEAISTKVENNSAYRNFAENLMTLATRGTTIAQTCRDLNINRQQFNKYLSGSVLPNSETMERIAQHYKMEAAKLFAAASTFRKPDFQFGLFSSNKQNDRLLRFENILSSLRNEKQAVGLAEGVYCHYFPWMLDSSRCVRGVSIIAKQDECTFFTRLTRFRVPHGDKCRWRVVAVDGVAIRESNRLILVGLTRDDTLGSSTINITMPAYRSGKQLLTGIISTSNPSGTPVACKFAMHRVGAVEDWRKHYRRCSLLAFDDPSLPSELHTLNEIEAGPTKGVLYPFDFTSDWQKV